MHLLESLLALHAVAADRGYLDRAADLINLLTGRFLQGPTAVLVEYFDADWHPRGGPDFPFEPGHHFEWVWLLSEYERLGGRPVAGVAAGLWNQANAIGVGAEGTIFDEVSPGRGAITRGTRLWPYTEWAKAACCHLPAESVRRDPEDLLDALYRRFLAPAHPGCWIDHYDAEGRPKSDGVPASSLYHICCAVDEVLRCQAAHTGPL